MDTQAEMARLKERHSAAVRVVCDRKQPQGIRDGADKVAKNLAWAMLLLEAMEIKKQGREKIASLAKLYDNAAPNQCESGMT